MANKTQHYSLTKPTPEEFYSVEDQNGNMDIIDDALKNHKHSASDITSDILPVDRGGTGSDDLSNITVGNAQKFNSKGFSQLFDSNNKALKAVQADAATQATTAGKAQDSDKLGGIAASGYSQTNHKHSASDITSGTLPVAHGGIGATSLADITVGNASKLGGTAASGYLLKDTAMQWYNLELSNEFIPSTSQHPQYMRDNGGWVQVICSFKRDTPPTAYEQLALLPQGYRPAKQIHAPVVAGCGTSGASWCSYVTINTNGSINFYNGSTVPSGWPVGGALGFNVTFKTIV